MAFYHEDFAFHSPKVWHVDTSQARELFQLVFLHSLITCFKMGFKLLNPLSD